MKNVEQLLCKKAQYPIQISKLVIRIEIDDTDITDQSQNNQNKVVNLSNLNISTNLYYSASTSSSESRDDVNSNQTQTQTQTPDHLSHFIGKRNISDLISIQTYYWNKHLLKDNSPPQVNKTPTKTFMNNNNNKNNKKNSCCNQELVNSAMTMQKALEMAYNDWNKNKQTSELEETTQTTLLQLNNEIDVNLKKKI
jgi:hypothetical protein